MYLAVKHVKPLENYHLLLIFDNGEERVFDARPLLSFGRFSELNSPDVFNAVHVSFDAIAWPNGLDIDPEYLYEHSQALSRIPRSATPARR